MKQELHVIFIRELFNEILFYRKEKLLIEIKGLKQGKSTAKPNFKNSLVREKDTKKLEHFQVSRRVMRIEKKNDGNLFEIFIKYRVLHLKRNPIEIRGLRSKNCMLLAWGIKY